MMMHLTNRLEEEEKRIPKMVDLDFFFLCDNQIKS